MTDASVQLASAAFAVEFAWMQLFAAAGCLDDEQRAEAVAAVAEYTTALQSELQVAGYYTGKVDGIYGPETVAAVEALQEAAGLPVTGTRRRTDRARARRGVASPVRQCGGRRRPRTTRRFRVR